MRYTAELGSMGAPNADGFGAAANTRPFFIKDEAGDVVFASRAADTPQSADRCVAAGGFQRSGEWRDGTTEVIPTPADVVRKRRINMLAISGAVVVGLASCTAWAFSQGATEQDATEACDNRMLDIVTEAKPDDIRDTQARDFEPTTGNYSRAWNASGVVRSDYMTGIERDIPYTCTIYLDSSGQELDGSVNIQF